MRYCQNCGSQLERAVLEGRERLKCRSEECDFVHWDNPIPIVAAILEMEDSVILVRNQGWPEKMFGLVTGFLERGETPEESILREVDEELGLEAEISDFVGYYPFLQMNQLILVFHLRAHGDLKLGEEIAEAKRVPIPMLRPWPFGTGPAVKDWLQTRMPPDHQA